MAGTPEYYAFQADSKFLQLTLLKLPSTPSAAACSTPSVVTSGIIARRSTAAIALDPFCISYLAGAHAELDNFDDALYCIREAMTKVETTKERWFEAEIKRMAGEIALLLPDPDATKAEEYFEHALAV